MTQTPVRAVRSAATAPARPASASTRRKSSPPSARSPTTGTSTPTRCVERQRRRRAAGPRHRRRFRPAAATRSCSRPRTRRRASTPSCNRTSATTATASPIRFNIASAPIPARTRKLWVEDTGRWFAGRDGKPLRAHGVVRVINERYEHERRLTYLARYDGLTGELNRHHLTEVLEDTHRGRDPLPLVVRLPAGRHRQPRAHQRVLRLRHRRSGDRRGRQAPAQPHARQGHARPLFRQQVRPRAARLHARRHGDCRRADAGRRSATTWCRPAPGRSR